MSDVRGARCEVLSYQWSGEWRYMYGDTLIHCTMYLNIYARVVYVCSFLYIYIDTDIFLDTNH